MDHIPSIDDWVCASHNVGLVVHKGAAKCPKDRCLGWMSPAEVVSLRSVHERYALTNSGYLLRNKMFRETESDRVWLDSLGWSPSDDYRMWWHLFGGYLPMRFVLEAEVCEDLARFKDAGDVEMPVWVTAMAGPVEEDAEALFPETDRRIKNGIVIDDDGHTLVLALLASWHKEPEPKEVDLAVHKALAENIVRSLHGGDDGR